MDSFSYFQPTSIVFGEGRVREAGAIVSRYGRRCLLVTEPRTSALRPAYEAAAEALRGAGVTVVHYDEVVPNPTVESVDRGAALARQEKVDVVLGFGGGSSMDTAKAIAVGATHEGSVWDYLFFRPKQPTERTLPIVAVSTTSGTGSQVTQVAVVTETGEPAPNRRSTIPSSTPVPASSIRPSWSRCRPMSRHPRASMPSATPSKPSCTPAAPRTSPSSPRRRCGWSRRTSNGRSATGPISRPRAGMAWADTLAGLCIANAGVTLPHGIGMTISGACPRVMHGESLAVVYPEFVRFTWESAVGKFAAMGRILDPRLGRVGEREAAADAGTVMDAFLKRIGMWLGLESLGVSKPDIGFIADHSRDLPDYKNNPRIASREDIFGMLERSWKR